MAERFCLPRPGYDSRKRRRGIPINLVLKALATYVIATSIFAAGWFYVEPMLKGAGAEARPTASAEPRTSTREVARAAATGNIRIVTRRQGVHHMVEGQVSGPGGTPVTVLFLVDTGASSVVLPRSLMETLGFDQTHVRRGYAQTARGKVKMDVGTLTRIAVGEGSDTAELEDVQVAFVADRHLGGMALLGMSFLGRYRVTFDDEQSEITLGEKR